MNKPKIAYLVSSHFSYAPFTVPILCPSLLNSGVPVEDIFMVVCGCRREFDVKTSQGNFWYVEHESRNFCVFVEAIAERRAEALKDYTHIFLLLDTCRAGPQFYFLSNQFDSSKDAIGANAFINNGCQSDIGAYRLEYLHSKSSVIAAYKNCEPLANYVWEGRMFAEATEKYFYGGQTGGMSVIADQKDIYGTGTQRITEYYSEVDLYKYKSNWGQNGTRMLDRC